MHLLINSISTPFAFVFFDSHGYSSVHHADLRGREFDTLLDELESCARKENMAIQDVTSIICVSGPAQFTSIRIVSLTLTTLAKSYDIPLYSLDFFELAELSGAMYPMVVNANRAEVVLKNSAQSSAMLAEKSTLPNGEYFGSALASDFANPEIRIQSELKYDQAIRFLPEKAHKIDQIEPYYLKRPNIT